MKAGEEVARAAWGAKVFWILAHVGIYLVLLFYPSGIHAKLFVDRNYVYFVLYNVCMLSCSLLYFTVGNEPGYVSPNDCEAPRLLPSENSSHSAPPIDIDDNGDSSDIAAPLAEPYWKRVSLNFCELCKLTQPLRTKHCGECGRCVSRFDHHCFFIGSCVGQRNHFRFWLYLFVQSFFFGWNCGLILPAYRSADSISGWLALNAPVFVCTIIVFPLFFVSLGLFVFHCYLALTNQSTWEVVKRHKITYLKDLDHDVLPFDRGFVQNIRDFVTMRRGAYTWEMPPARVQRGFNICINKYWSCF